MTSAPSADELASIEAVRVRKSEEFEDLISALPDTHWARYDLSAVRLGYELWRWAGRPGEPAKKPKGQPASGRARDTSIRPAWGVDEVGKYLGVSPITVTTGWRRMRIPAPIQRRPLRWRPEAIEAWAVAGQKERQQIEDIRWKRETTRW